MDLCMVVPGLSLISHDISFSATFLDPYCRKGACEQDSVHNVRASDFTWSFGLF